MRTTVAIIPDGDQAASPPATKPQVARRIRRHVEGDLYDESGASVPEGIATYSLADPSDLHLLRYIGQTGSPRRRFLQHLNTARLWMPADCPWWVKSPKLRPLYEWIRSIYRQDSRLPTMVVWAWMEDGTRARVAERARICEALACGVPLLNAEAARAATQPQLRLPAP